MDRRHLRVQTKARPGPAGNGAEGWHETVLQPVRESGHLLLLGSDLAQLMELGAAIAGAFRTTSLIHTSDVLGRAAECAAAGQAVVAFLDVAAPDGVEEAGLSSVLIIRDFISPSGQRRTNVLVSGADLASPGMAFLLRLLGGAIRKPGRVHGTPAFVRTAGGMSVRRRGRR